MPQTTAAAPLRLMIVACDAESYGSGGSDAERRALSRHFYEVMGRTIDAHRPPSQGGEKPYRKPLTVAWQRAWPKNSDLLSRPVLGGGTTESYLPAEHSLLDPRAAAWWALHDRVGTVHSEKHKDVPADFLRSWPPSGCFPGIVESRARAREEFRDAAWLTRLCERLSDHGNRYLPEFARAAFRRPSSAGTTSASRRWWTALAGPEGGGDCARELSYLTLVLWKRRCDDGVDRSDQSPGALRDLTFSHFAPKYIWEPAEEFAAARMDSWPCFGDFLPGMSAWLLWEHVRDVSGPLGRATGLPDRRARFCSAAFPDLAPVWQALADFWRADRTTMPLRLHRDEFDRGQLLPACFTYRTADPYAIEVVFRPSSPGSKRWVFARDLLLDGLDHSTGEGNVVVWPRSRPSGEDGTFILLKSPQGTAMLSLSRTDLANYLDQTQRTIPAGAEHQHMSRALTSLEEQLAALTSGAAG